MGNKQSSTTSNTIAKPKDSIGCSRRINVQTVQNVLLIWLDRNINGGSADCQNTITQLGKTVNSIKLFTDGQQCIEFLESMHDGKACMIISGGLSQQIIPQIHGLAQVDTIFIFCRNQQFHQTWAKNWPKIKGVFTDIGYICEALKKIAQQYEHDSISMSFVTTSSGSIKKDQLDPSFMYSTIIKEILLTIKFEQRHIQEYIKYCREKFAGNDNELKNITKFENERTKMSPIWWYTYECFLYRMLNLCIRTLDGDIITKIGFFIADLHRQIDELHREQFGDDQSNSPLIVYRGQRMAKTEFENLEQNKGGLLCFNNFLSTSKRHELALVFAPTDTENPDIVGILFVMTIQPNQSTTPFASIAHISNFGIGEDEVLFGMHSIFRINDIQSMTDYPGTFRVDLTLTSDNDMDLQKLTDRIRQETFPDSEGWERLGMVLGNMGQFAKAQQVYEMLLEEETVESEKAPIYHQLGLMKYNQGEYKEAIIYYEKSISIEEKHTPLRHMNLGSSYNNIGLVYDNMGKYTKALYYYERSLTIKEQSLPANHPDLAASYGNIGIVYKNMGEYTKALSYYERSLSIQEQSLPSNHPDLAASYNNIGGVYDNMSEYAKALSNYEKSLKIKQQSLPANHPDLAASYNNIGNVYDKMGEYTKALSYYEKSLAIQEQSLPTNHPDLASTYNNVGTTYENMKNYSKACSFCEKAIDIAQKSLPTNHPHRKKYENNLDQIKAKM